MAENPRLDELKRRVQMDPASIAFAALAEEYRRLGQFREAIDVCKVGLQRHPSYISAHVTLGRALIEVGEYDEAKEELEYVLRVAPENLAAIRGLAEIHHRRGELPEATDHYHPPPVAVPVPVDTTLGHGGAAAPQGAMQAAAADDPALAGLEQFLAAILRAREHASAIERR